jgi:hypothetical protein
MTHFVTLAYLRLFAPWLVLLLGALTGVWLRATVLAAIALAAMHFGAPPEELFSRALACDGLACIALVLIAASEGRAPTRRDLLCAFALALVAAGNDTLSVAAALVIASASAHHPGPWPLLAAAAAFAWTGETELALVLQHSPAAAIAFAALCLIALPWRFASLVAGVALCARLIGLAWLGPAHSWLLH